MNFFPPKTLELTLAVIKPHAAKLPPVVENIKEEILKQNFFIVRYARRALDLKVVSQLYEEHKGKPFYQRLISMMTSAPIECFILAREKGITGWRGMMGPTRVYDAIFKEPHSFRSQYGLSNTRNATHGSDSPKSAEREGRIFFPDFDQKNWYDKEEVYFRNGYVKFDDNKFIHCAEKEDIPEGLLGKKKCK